MLAKGKLMFMSRKLLYISDFRVFLQPERQGVRGWPFLTGNTRFEGFFARTVNFLRLNIFAQH